MDLKTHVVVFAVVFIIILCSESTLVSARGARGGGARGGGSRGGSRGSSSRGSSSRGSSARSSRGARLSSSYISYNPGIRRTRVYTYSYNTYYYSYYNMYFYYSGSYYYIHRRRPSGDMYVCANYEANENGTTMGVFSCPNTWEPDSFVYCCGEDYAQFCCEDKPGASWTTIVGVVFAVLILIVIVMIIIRNFKNGTWGSCCETKRHTTITTTTRSAIVLPPATTQSSNVTSSVGYTADANNYQPPVYPGQAAPYGPTPPYMPTNDSAMPYPADSSAVGAYPQQPPAYDNPGFGDGPKVAPPAYESVADYKAPPIDNPSSTNGGLPYPTTPGQPNPPTIDQPNMPTTAPYPPSADQPNMPTTAPYPSGDPSYPVASNPNTSALPYPPSGTSV